MFQYFKESLRRKIARKITKEYPVRIDSFELEGVGRVRFANWQNPLVRAVQLQTDDLGFFQRFLKKGDFVIDIGANIGHLALLMSLAVGKEGLVLAFDPNPYVFKILENNVALNPEKSRIQAHPYAISDAEKDLFYISSEASFNNGGISESSADAHGNYQLKDKVKGIHLESFLKRNYPNDLSRLRLIKIDTEGYDREVIKSIRGLLSQFKPVVISECFGKTNASERAEHFDLLHSLGYKLFYISGFSPTAELVPILNPADMMKWKHFDICALAS